MIGPELQQNIVDLGLVYDGDVDATGRATVIMTLTTPHCPLASQIVEAVRTTLVAQPGVTTADVRLVWDPPWTPYRTADDLKASLGLPAQEPPPPTIGEPHGGLQLQALIRHAARRLSALLAPGRG